MSEMDSHQVDLFRRRRFEAPHRRRHPLIRLARPFAGAVAAVGVPVALIYWLLTSPQLEIRELVAGSTGRVSPLWVETRLEPLRGRHLLAVGLAEVRECLVGHPWIDHVVVHRKLPGRLEVAVIEKQPAAVWNDGGTLYFIDGAGRRIAPLDADSGELDLPIVSVAGDAPAATAATAAAVAMVADWQSLRPDDPVSQIEVLGSGDFRLVTAALPFAVLVRSDRLAAAPAALDRAVRLINHRYGRVATVDLRFSRQIVFQPAARPPQEEG